MNSKLTGVLVILLVVASFFIGSLYTEVRYLKGQGGVVPAATTGVNNGTATGTQTAPTAAQSATPQKVDIKLDNLDPIRGNQNAKVTVVEFADYQCPFCGALSGYNKSMVDYMKQNDSSWEPFLPNALKDYVDSGKVRLIYKDFAFLDGGKDDGESHLAAQAAHCANDQGKYFEYHDLLYSNQNGENKGAFAKDKLLGFAENLKLNTTDFKNCLDTQKYLSKVKDNTTSARAYKVNSTPSIFVDGTMVTDDSGQAGTFTYSVYKAKIEEALKAK